MALTLIAVNGKKQSMKLTNYKPTSLAMLVNNEHCTVVGNAKF